MSEDKEEIVEVMAASDAIQSVSVPDHIKAQLVEELRPVAVRLSEYSNFAANIKVNNVVDAERAVAVLASIDTDLKAVADQEILSKVTDGLHKLHRRWTALRARFTDPLNTSKRTIRGAVVAWQEVERQKAEALERKLQAERDAKARKEAEKLAARAAKAEANGDAEKAASLIEQSEAASVAPTVTVAAPKAIGVRKVWKVTNIDMDLFLRAAVNDTNLRGYIEFKITALERAKAANQALSVQGVTFQQVVR